MSRSYVFAEFRVTPALRELWRGDQLIELPPHVFDCLAYLIERHDRAVGRDELVAAVWGKTEISDTLLGQTVLRIRRELGDDARQQRALRTIPRFGYRWVAALEIRDGPSPSAALIGEPATAAESDTASADFAAKVVTPDSPMIGVRPARRAVTLVVVIVLIAATLALMSFIRGHHPSVANVPVASPGEHALASVVLPAGIDAGSESAWMRLGVMDIVAGRLRSSGLPSVPSEAVVALLNAPVANRGGSLRQILAADLLVTPRVQNIDANWQIDLDADDGAGQHFTVKASAREVTAAARSAADKLLVALGRRAPQASAESSAAKMLIERIDAAVLADDADGARALIAQASPEDRQMPELRLREAKIDFRGGHFDAARARLTALLDEAPAATLPVLHASILNGLGAVAIREDKPQQAEQLFGEAVALLAAHAEPAELGQALLGRAAAAADQRHFDAAAADYARARIALRQANDTLALLRVAANEGFVEFEQGRPAPALPQLIAAGDGFRQWGALNEAILTDIGRIACHLALLDSRAAMQVADAAQLLAQRIDNRSTLDALALARARALAAVGRLREARDTLDRLRSANADPLTVAAAGAVLARLELDADHVAAAGDLAEAAVSALAAPSVSAARAEAWFTQIRAAVRSADAGRADAAIAAFDAWAAHTDEPRARLYARLVHAEYARQFERTDAWRSAFDAARQLAAQGAVPYEIAAAAMSYANALFAEGDIDAAAVEVGRVSRWSEQDFSCAVLEARLYAALGRDDARQTAVSRARALAGERSIPADALAVTISTRAARQ